MFKDFRYSKDTLQTRKSFYYSFRYLIHDTVKIHSRHGSHSITHSEFEVKIQFRDAPDTDAILLLIQTSTIMIQVRMHSRHESHYITHSEFKIKIQYGYTPYKEFILSPIHILVQIRPR